MPFSTTSSSLSGCRAIMLLDVVNNKNKKSKKNKNKTTTTSSSTAAGASSWRRRSANANSNAINRHHAPSFSFLSMARAASSRTGRRPSSSSSNAAALPSSLFSLPFSSVLLAAVALLPLLATNANGYLVGRLYSLQNVADAHRQLLAATSSGDQRALMQPPLVLDMPARRAASMPEEAGMENAGGKSLGAVEEEAELPPPPQPIVRYAKKSLMSSLGGGGGMGGYKGLTKFNGGGSRNCFFTPIQCMIQHDMSKYKKLVDSDIRMQLTTGR